MENQIKTIIIDDEEVGCEGIKNNLSTLKTIDITGVFYRAEDALAWLETHSADVATVDYYMPGLHGIALIKRLKTDYPDMKLIIITSERNPYLLRQILNTNIDSLLVKGPFNVLQKAIHTVMEGKTLLQPEFGIPIYRAEQAIQVVNTLTDTQRFCFEQIALKKSIEEIARLQKTTSSTVNDRLLQCRKKLHVKTTEDLIKLYHTFYPMEKTIV